MKQIYNVLSLCGTIFKNNLIIGYFHIWMALVKKQALYLMSTCTKN